MDLLSLKIAMTSYIFICGIGRLGNKEPDLERRLISTV
jgi:hypothetical protein